MIQRIPCFHAALAALVILAATGPVAAQELDPRAYANTPTGINLLSVVYAYSSGNVLLDPSLPIEGLDGKLNIGTLAYGRSFGLFRRSAKMAFLVPYAFGDWKGMVAGIPEERNASGFGDMRLKLHWNFVGAPALNSREFPSYRQKTIVGANLLIVAPTGDYDSDELLNLSSNRWSVRTELGASRAFGNWSLELLGNVWWFGDNNNFFGGRKLTQDPLYVVKTHLIYSFRPGLWLGGGIGYGKGGRSSVDSVPRETEQENYRFGITFGYPINKQHGIRFDYVRADNGGAGAEFDAFVFRYQYAWGDL